MLQLRPEEPQSYRDLALVILRAADEAGEYEEGLELLWEVVRTPWDRFFGIEQVVLMEMNRYIPAAERAGIDTDFIDDRFVTLLDSDLRVVMTWDADLTDMDLWVTNPEGERIYYGDRRGEDGGFYNYDFTRGYGPEEYFIKKALEGGYRVEGNYFGSGSVTLTGSIILQIEIYTNYGRANEERQVVSFRLSGRGETYQAGTVEF